MAFEKYVDKDVEDAEENDDIAKSMLVLMVRGVFTKLKFAYTQFPCASIRAYQLYDILWKRYSI
jgi:hypothetical protein